MLRRKNGNQASPMIVEHLLTSRRAGPRLRVALLLDDTSLPRPFAEAVDHVLRCDFATLALVIRERHTNGEAANGLGGLLAPENRASLLYHLFQRWDLSRTRREAEQKLRKTDVSGRLLEVPAITVSPIAAGDSLLYPDSVVTRAREHHIDVALRLASGRVTGNALSIACHGVWSYKLGDSERYREGPAHFWELAENDPVSVVSLQAELPGRPAPLVLLKGFADSVCRSSDLSATRNRIKPMLLGSTFFIRKLKQLHEDGFDALEAEAVPPGPYRGRRPRYGAPSNGDMAQYLLPRVLRKPAQRLRRYSTLLRWRMAVRVGGTPSFDDSAAFDVNGFRWIEPPPGHAYADPFLVRRSGQTFCLFEEIDLATRRGRISCAVVDADGALQDIRTALDRPYHLSYPFVFEDDGEMFLVPESSKNKTVDLYRAIEFPSRWEKVTTLLHGRGLDTTILRHGGLYWFFVAVREPEGASEQLLLFFSESLTGPLRFHPKNPISLDIRRCRPAGSIMVQDGRLIRPSQDCSVTYGRQLNFNEITTLTPDDYAERLTVTIAPPDGLEGIHTYNRCGRIEVLDGKQYESVAWHLTIASALKLYGARARR